MIKLAVDAMGGDYAPQSIIQGVLKILKKEKSLDIFVYGDQNQINLILQSDDIYPNNSELQKRIHIIHTPFALDMGVKNVREKLRDQPQYSMFLALQAAKMNQVDGVISAGPTQALVWGSFALIRTIPSVKRIALAPVFVSLAGNKKMLLDAGANLELQPAHLVELTICATITVQILFNISKPVVKLLNIGKEKGKGRIFENNIYDLLQKNKNINFQGNEEPQNLLHTTADILISDGFTANMVLKSYEGAFKNLTQEIKKILTQNIFKKIISKLFFAKPFKTIQTIDNKKIGGAILLGLNKIVVKAHGDSDAETFYNAIKQTYKLIKNNFLQKMTIQLTKDKN